jgi:hypothetical protein
MANTYRFRFTAQQVERGHHGYISIIYGGPETRFASLDAVMTWKEAQAHLLTFAAEQVKPCACLVSCFTKPVPPGYNKAKRTVFANMNHPEN